MYLFLIARWRHYCAHPFRVYSIFLLVTRLVTFYLRLKSFQNSRYRATLSRVAYVKFDKVLTTQLFHR